MAGDILVLFSYYRNLGYLWPSVVVFNLGCLPEVRVRILIKIDQKRESSIRQSKPTILKIDFF